MSMNPFSIDVVISGQGKKLFEQLSGLTPEQAQELLEGGYFTALREAKKAGTLPPINQLRDFLMGRRRLEVAVDIDRWKIWKTIKLGTGIKGGNGFCAELKKRGFQVSENARGMLYQSVFTVATAEEEIDLVVPSVGDLGFKDGARYDAICARAIEMCLERCPVEVGPQLRIQYHDQPLGECLLIAMEDFCDYSSGDLKIFVVKYDMLEGQLEGPCDHALDSVSGHPAKIWGAGCRIVFQLPRKKPLVA